MMRKMHYDEGMNIRLARELIAKELEEDDDDEEMRDDTEDPRDNAEETEEISVDPPQEGKEKGDTVPSHIRTCRKGASKATTGMSKHVG